MILLHVLTKDKTQAREIADLLVREKLILTAVTHRAVKTSSLKDGVLHEEKQYLVLGKTKALLFDTIDRKLKEIYGDDLPTLYSVPIVQMDWDQTSELKERTAKV